MITELRVGVCFQGGLTSLNHAVSPQFLQRAKLFLVALGCSSIRLFVLAIVILPKVSLAGEMNRIGEQKPAAGAGQFLWLQ